MEAGYWKVSCCQKLCSLQGRGDQELRPGSPSQVPRRMCSSLVPSYSCGQEWTSASVASQHLFSLFLINKKSLSCVDPHVVQVGLTPSLCPSKSHSHKQTKAQRHQSDNPIIWAQWFVQEWTCDSGQDNQRIFLWNSEKRLPVSTRGRRWWNVMLGLWLPDAGFQLNDPVAFLLSPFCLN